MENSLCVIIPTYKRPASVKSLVKSILKDKIDRVIVLNTDKENLNLKISDKRLEVVNCYPKNLLQAKNDCLRKLKCKWVLILDDDILLLDDTILEFKNAILESKADFISGYLLQKRQLRFGILFSRFYGDFTFYGVADFAKRIKQKGCYRVKVLPGGFMLCKRKALIDTGLFDENYLYPFYNEDTDLTYRAYKKGYNLIIHPKIKAIHKKESRGGVREKMPKKDYFYSFGFNNSYFRFKNFSGFKYLLYSIFRVHDHLHAMMSFKGKYFKFYLKGIIDGYKKARS